MKKLMTIATSLTSALGLAAAVWASNPQPCPANGSCHTMCQDIKDGDPFGTLDSDCQACCSQLGYTGDALTHCDANCLGNTYPCSCP